jgi:uncharacterized protein (DUF885 family)
MKKTIIGIAVLTIFLAACNGGSITATETKSSTDSSVSKQTASTGVNQQATKAPISIKDILDDYLKMKNAFAKDNDKDAATAGKEMVKSFEKFDKTQLTADQAKSFTDIQDDAKEHAEHIGTNAGNIKHQREHFDMLSQDIYKLVKTFGAGQTLYYDHCPMYNDNKGADWISETKDIKNPYLGKSMPTCGSVKEELK